MRMMPAAFEFADATPLPTPDADARAAAIRPGAVDRTLASTTRAPWRASRKTGLAIALAAHSALLAGVLMWRAEASLSAADEEIPIEIVVESPGAVADPAPPASQPAVPPMAALDAEQPAPAPSDAAPQATPPAATETSTEPQAETTAARVAPPVERSDEALLARERAAAARAAAERRAETERERKLQVRRAAEREEKQQARRAAERAQREQATRERQRVASLSPDAGAGRAARAAPHDAFDAASYRAIVARAVSIAVARACPSGERGRVVVALTIGASGRIAGVALGGSSGDGALDAAALGAVRRAGPFPAPAGRSSVIVPVAVTCR
ncbi:MAG: TonB family protein [Hyphomicrobiales bacterium]|nr:TonB family protein [Hyphomicrobiales bacterium]